MIKKRTEISTIINKELQQQKRNKNWLAQQTTIPYRTLWRKLKGTGENLTLNETIAILNALALTFTEFAKRLEPTNKDTQ